jgi:hypothetical protein
MSQEGDRAMPIYPPEKFGRDHHALILYLETVAVDRRGYPDVRHVRTNPHRHRERVSGAIQRDVHWDPKYTTKLRGGEPAEDGHDDWDAIEDLIAAGLLEWRGTGFAPRFVLTDKGWELAHQLRRLRAKEGLSR